LDAVGSGAGASMAIVDAGEGLATPRVILGDDQARPFRRGTFEPQEDLTLVRGMAPG
jgi:hypothetical protein